MEIRRGEIYYADLDGVGSEQRGLRPVLIIQNNIGNRHSPTVIVACLTTQSKPPLPTHVQWQQSTILCEQIKTIDKARLLNQCGILTPPQQNAVNRAIKISLDLHSL